MNYRKFGRTGLSISPLVLGTANSLKQIDELFPGPGGPAPEAYAW